jgi:hypothetical protein
VHFASKSLYKTLLALFFGVTGVPAQAQEKQPGFEPLTVVVDPNGVDLLSGRVTFPIPKLEVPVVPSLALSRAQDFAYYLAGKTNPSDPESGGLIYTVNIRVGLATSESFKCIDGDCRSQSPRSGALTDGFAVGSFAYTEPGSGRRIRYDSKQSKDEQPTGTTFAYWATQVEYPDGEILTIDYEKALPTPALTFHRVIAVKSNRGFQLRFTYTGTDPRLGGWSGPATAAIYRDGAATPLASVSYTGESVTDMAGKVWTGTFRNAFGVEAATATGAYRPPTNSSDQIVAISAAADGNGMLLTRLVKGDQIWEYTYSHAPNGGSPGNQDQPRSITITGPLGYLRTLSISDSPNQAPLIRQETDALNRLVKYEYDFRKRIRRIDYPEGNAVEVVYDDIGNITKRTTIPKQGSGLAAIVEEAVYSDDPNYIAQCEVSPLITCFRPIRIKDARGNITNYVWSDEHGGLLKETKPADVNGIRPETRYEYAQRYTWIPAAGGGYVRSTSPFWVKVKESTCRFGAAGVNGSSQCAGGAGDEVVTQYDYGPDSGPNDLLLRGMTVTATNASGAFETLRTCYAYDERGRRISETKAAASLTVCP